MKNKKIDPVHRKKIILSGLGILIAFTGYKLFRFSSGKQTRKKVKMLTQDGKLVEVDALQIPQQKKKISNKELQHWINKKSNSGS